MSATKPFKTREAMLPDGKPIGVWDNIWVAHGSKTLPATVIFIDISGKEAGDAPSVRALVYDAISHTLNVGIKPNPAVLNVGSGLRHISDKNNRGIRFARDNQEELDWLLAWQAEHGRTGGTGDPSQSPDPSKIPWTPYVEQGGKPDSGGGESGGGGPVEHPGKDEGEIIGAPDDRKEFHPADVNKDGLIDREEKKVWNKKNPDNPVERGKY